MTKPRRSHGRTLEQWLAANGAEVLPVCAYEQARFRAQDGLCIIYERNRKGRITCVPALAREAMDAWEAGKPLDLSNSAPLGEAPVEDWHAMGIALTAVAARVKAGEEIDIDEEAEKLGILPPRLVRALRAHGAIIPEFA